MVVVAGFILVSLSIDVVWLLLHTLYVICDSVIMRLF